MQGEGVLGWVEGEEGWGVKLLKMCGLGCRSGRGRGRLFCGMWVVMEGVRSLKGFLELSDAA